MKTVFVYSGQSSKRPGMLERALAATPSLRATIDEASEILGRDVLAHYARGKDAFACNRDIQVGVFLCSHLHQLALAERGVHCQLSLGLSLGEYNHLVQIGALDFEGALRLVEARGDAYDRGPAGVMAAVFPLEEEHLQLHIEAARRRGRIEIANYNSPSQHVIAGDRAAVEACLERIEEDEFGVMGVIIEDKIPMHTSPFEPTVELFRPHLEAAPWKSPAAPYVPNALGEPFPGSLDDPSSVKPADIIDCLSKHVCRPVLWRHSVDSLRQRHDDLGFVEIGPARVLSDLMNRRWVGTPPLPTDHKQDVTLAYQAIVEAHGR